MLTREERKALKSELEVYLRSTEPYKSALKKIDLDRVIKLRPPYWQSYRFIIRTDENVSIPQDALFKVYKGLEVCWRTKL